MKQRVTRGALALTLTVLAPLAACANESREIEVSSRSLVADVITPPGSMPSATTPVASDTYDFLVQDVCLDDADRVLPDDPAACKKRRNLRIGESLPYVKIDMGDGFQLAPKPGWQRSDSIPMLTRSGRSLVISSNSLSARRNGHAAVGGAPLQIDTNLDDVRNLRDSRPAHHSE